MILNPQNIKISFSFLKSDALAASRRFGSSSVDGNLLSNGDISEMLRLRELSLSLNSLGGVSNHSSSSTITRSGLDTANMSSADLCQLGQHLFEYFWLGLVKIKIIN